MSDTAPDPGSRTVAESPFVRVRDRLPPQLRRWWPALLAAAALGGVIVLFLLWFGIVYRTASIPPAGAASIQSPTQILAASGEPLAQLDPATVGEEVAADDLPEHVVQAILAAEDRRYWDHGGISVRGAVRAALANLRSGEIEQGASTITQQYVDLTTEGAGRSLVEKLREMAAALRYEDELGKQEVLDRYLNVVPFGRDTTGIDGAAQVYFRVPAAELDVNQAATLAGIIAAPSAFDPERNPEDAERRRNIVLEAMGEEGWLAEDEVQQLTSAPLPEVSDEPLVQYGDDAYVVDAVRRTLERELEGADISRGLVVETSIDPRLQELAQATVRAHVAEQSYTGAIVTIDPASGAIRALVGGADFEQENYNAAIQAQRQPGSSFKPLTLAAFVEAGFAPDASRFDAPASLEVDSGPETVEVHNFGNQGYGELTVREATRNSVNTVYMQMIDQVGPEAVVDLAERIGITSEIPPFPSIALGAGEVTPLEMASAYATFAAQGVHRTPVLVTRVVEADGEVVYEADVQEEQAVPEQVAGVVTDVLQDVVEAGTGTAAQIGHPVAGKTGTTDDGRDTWFVGYTAQLATSVWVGNADNSPMGDVTGGELAAPLWADYMSQAMEPLEPTELPVAGQDGLRALDESAPDREPEPAQEPEPPPEPPQPEPEPEPEPEPTEEEPEPEPEPTEPEPTEPEPTDDGGDGNGDGGDDDATTEETTTQSTTTEEPTTEAPTTEEPTAEETTTDDGSTDDDSTEGG